MPESTDLLQARKLLLFGCGYVGTRLAQRLQREQRHVLAFVRNPARADELSKSGIECQTVDLDRLPLPASDLRHSDGAQLVYLVPPPDSGVHDSRLANFLRHGELARPASIVYFSTTGVYGDARGGLVTEQSPVAPVTDRARRRVDAEVQLMHWCGSRGIRLVILRVPGIYGPHRLPLERLRRGDPAITPDAAGPGNRIHVDDLVAACVAALERDVSGIFNIVDGDHTSTPEFLVLTARLAGLPAPPLLPRAAALRAASPALREWLEESRCVTNQRMLVDLGVSLRYPTSEAGIRASLQEMSR